jgi:hypothetical protein
MVKTLKLARQPFHHAQFGPVSSLHHQFSARTSYRKVSFVDLGPRMGSSNQGFHIAVKAKMTMTSVDVV